ncbi:GumC family protein [Sinorhizobium mexicanum]|uniref:Lipopolysaccharide biosynthesis protein n=1 Tax=Sinorhizobium mexicanum TaxID=375549 RepID=A0A859QUJ7_9HYPH|nr:Wzz/FepE/Etk N-terminal domain-containing protein [Sinorhizobium mexicanum]MBP1887297.1 polysaccharide chain length determinant protein (PEP-CTERM system associated) [Sinorhizobium mexicanum]QLL65817.1 lipopolysaccharide biosynthesis protein [Sinorhizobium mexicanum]
MRDVDLRFYISILWRRLPYVLTITILALAISVLVARALPPVYRASAKILVEAPQIPADLARSTVPTTAVDQFQIIQQQITTREYLLALADKLDFYGNNLSGEKLSGGEELSSEDIVEDMRSRITFEQLDSLSAKTGTSIFDVSFEAGEPVLAAKTVNELVAMILRSNQRQRTDRAGDTLRFFDREVARLGSELNRLEADILKFKSKNKDTLPESLDFRRRQQISQQERLTLLEREEAALRSRRSSLTDAYATGTPSAVSGPVTPEQQMLQDLNRALAEQLAIFSENSPNIIALRARIVSLQRGLMSNQATDTSASKKALSGLELQLSDTDQRLEIIGREKTAITQSIADLTQSIVATPASETALNSLERNRLNVQTQYNAAIARRAEALIGEQIELRSDGGRFSLLEPASPPQSPISPKRRRIVAIGAAAGIGLSLALVALLEILNRTVRRPSELAQLLQYQPLATIPHIPTPAEARAASRKRGVARGIAAALVAAGIPGTLATIHYYYSPIDLIFQKFISN